MGGARTESRNRRAVQVEERLALPVIVASVISVPAVFLTALPGGVALVGKTLNWASSVILLGESVLLFLLSGHRLAWLRSHLWPILIALLAVPAVVFALAPLQVLRLLRLVHVVTALRLLRVNRILGSAEALRRHLRLGAFWQHLEMAMAAAIAAGFLSLVVADPHTKTRELLHTLTTRFGVVPVGIVLVLIGTTAAMVFRRLQHLAYQRLSRLLAAWWPRLAEWVDAAVDDVRERIAHQSASSPPLAERMPSISTSPVTSSVTGLEPSTVSTTDTDADP